jgi:Uma2 family endonuclease
MTRASATEDARLLTGEDLERLSGIGPCELIDGRIVPMSPTGDEHGRIEVNFSVALKGFVKSRRLGHVLGGEVGVYTQRGPDRVRGADVAYLSNERYARRGRAGGFLEVAPDLVVEILSPNDTVGELTQKLREYFAIGVRVVWVADPAARCVFVHRSLTDVREFRESDRLPGDDVLPGFDEPVAALFEE